VTGGNFSILYALNAAKGTQEWSYEPYTSVCSGGSSCSSDEFSAPAVSNGVVYFDADLFASTEIDSVFALSASTGAVQWTTSAVTLVGRTFTPAVTGSAVYVAGKNTLYALHTSDGSLKWSSSPAPIEITTDPATANGSVFVGGYSGVLYDLRATNGLLKWSTNPSSGSPLSDARIANGIVYVGSSGVDTDAGAVSALNESSGSLLWSFNGGVEDFSSIAILNGMLYVSANDAGSALNAFGVPAATSRTR
jgi:outer membrane protein assembly factor BamB